jgi:uncharacterized coiled-coil protein SlyX
VTLGTNDHCQITLVSGVFFNGGFMNTLFVIEQELKLLLDQIGDESGDLNDEQRQLAIGNLNEALTSKTDQVAHFRESLNYLVDHINDKMSELKDRKDFYERKIEKFDEYVQACLAIGNKDKIEGKLYKISKRKPSLKVEIFDESLIPIEFIKIPEPKPQIMKDEISKALKQGEIIEGARLIEGKSSLTYKVK